MTLVSQIAIALSLQLSAPPADSAAMLLDSDLQAVGMRRHWQSELPLPVGEQAAGMNLLDEFLYVWTVQGSAACIHAETGLALWAQNLNEGRYRFFPPTHLRTSDGQALVAFVSTNAVHVLEAGTGLGVAEFRLPFAHGSPATGDGDYLYMGSTDGHFYCLDWTQARHNGKPIQYWRVLLGGPIRSTPLFDGQALVAADSTGHVYGFDSARFLHWKTNIAGGTEAALLSHESGIYVAARQRTVYRLAPDDGSIRWGRQLPVPLKEAPVIAGRTLYQDCGSAGLFAVDIDSGDMTWAQAKAGPFVARKADRVFALAANGEQILWLDNDSGSVIRALPLRDLSLATANAGSEAMYLVSKQNQVVCVRAEDVPPVTLAALSAARANRNANNAGEELPPVQTSDEPTRFTKIDILKSENQK